MFMQISTITLWLAFPAAPARGANGEVGWMAGYSLIK